MRILCESHYAFAIKCRFNGLHFELFHRIFFFFFCSISTWNYFPLFLWGCFIHLAVLFSLIPSWLRNWYWVPAMKPLAPNSTAFTIMPYCSFSSSFLRSLYLLVLYLWLWSIQTSYGIDNSAMMSLRFTLDRRTISGPRPWLDIIFW